jgi:hypothetical protein
MKTRLAIVIALASAGASFGVYALDGDVPAPSVGLPGSAPKLFPSEQGAFKALEVAAQIVESRIVQKGCQEATFPIEIHTTFNGSGTAVLGAAPSEVNLAIALGGASANNGRWYSVTGSGALDGLIFSNINGKGSFNIGSTIQELSTTWSATSSVTTLPDEFKGTIIKDYWRLATLQSIPNGFDDAGTPVSTVVDYGYQQVSKKNYVKAKYWQQSRTWRDDGVNAGTYWLKTRVAPAGTCAIEIKLAGYGESPTDNVEGFNEIGTLSVKSVVVGPAFQAAGSK